MFIRDVYLILRSKIVIALDINLLSLSNTAVMLIYAIVINNNIKRVRII